MVHVLLKPGLENFEHYWTENIILASKKGGGPVGQVSWMRALECRAVQGSAVRAGSDVLLFLGIS